MRVLLILAALSLAAPAGRADDPEARARAGLALASTVPVPADPESCGFCRTDLDECRAEAVRSGKPIVVFVGGCAARGNAIAEMGATPVRAATYDRDEVGRRDPARKRIAVITVSGGAMRVETLPAGVGLDAIRAAAFPPAGPAGPAPSSERLPLPVQAGGCPGGQCASPAAGNPGRRR